MMFDVQKYQRNGFAIVKGFFSSEELGLVKANVEQILQQVISESRPWDIYYEDQSTRSVRCAFRLHENSEYFRQLMGDPRLLRIVQEAFGGAEVIQDGVMLIDKPPNASYEFPYHQDNAYQFWPPPRPWRPRLPWTSRPPKTAPSSA